MIRITFEGTIQDVMKEMKDFVDNRAEGVVVEVPKNWTTQGVDPDEPKVEAAAAPAAPVTPVAPVAPVMPTKETVAPAAPTAPVKTYTLPEIQKALQPLMDEGRTAELVGLLQKFGVADLTKLPTDQYPDFIKDLRALGVRL